MDPLMWLLKNRYGSLELARQVGPNLLRGLAGSVFLHAFVVTALFVMTMVNSGDRTEIGRLVPPIEIIPAIPRPYVPPRIMRDLPVPKPPEVVTNPVPVVEDPAQTITKPLAGDGKTGIPGTIDQPGISTTGSIDVSPTAGDVGYMDNEIPPDTVFIAYEYPPMALDINPLPAYPEMAYISGVSGKVVMNVYVDKQGNVRQWKLMSVNPAGLGFDEEVEKVISKWRFTPAIQQDKPVGVWMAIPFKFTIKR